MVGHLVRNLEGANQYVPDDLMNLAMQSSWFRKSRFAGGKGKTVGGGAGLGFRERPEGNKSSSSSSGGYMHSFVGASSNNSKPSSSQPTNRLETLKNAFKSQYASQFKTSTDKSWESEIIPPGGVFAKPSLPSSTSTSSSSSSQQPQNDQAKKKKSRWD
jgi:ATP-dependent RNA helicase DDX42